MPSEIDWPDGYERTDPDDRRGYPGDISLGHPDSFRAIGDELSAWGAVLDRVEFAGTEYANDPNIPHKHEDVDDPGVVAYFRREGESTDDGYALACDSWDTQRDNARAISLYVRRMRLAERCGVETAQETMDTARLPPADEEAVAAPPAGAQSGDDPAPDREPHEVLGVSPDAPTAVVQSAARALKGEYHPDGDDDPAEFRAVRWAEEEMLDE